MTGVSGFSLFAGGALHLAFGGAFTLLLLVACFTDVRSRRIPNRLVVVLLALGIVYSVVLTGGLAGLWRAVGGTGLGFSIWIVFYVAGVLGAGDVKLAAAAGAWLGAGGIWRASLLGAAVGGLLAVGMLLRERRLSDALARMMTSVSTRSLAMLVPAAQHAAKGETAARRRALPYGVALAAGALAAAWVPGLLL